MNSPLKKRRQKQAAFKRRKKENQEHRVEIYLSAEAYQKMLAIIQEKGTTRSYYLNHLILSSSVCSLEDKVVVSTSTLPHPMNEDLEIVRLLAERNHLKQELEKHIYWGNRLEKINSALVNRLEEFEQTTQ